MDLVLVEKMIRDTRLYDNLDRKYEKDFVTGENKIYCENEDLLSLIFRLCKTGQKVAVVNYLEQTNLCQCSNLSLSLKSDLCKYLDSNRVLYSPDVVFSNGNEEVTCTVLTITDKTAKALKNVLWCAKENGISTVIIKEDKGVRVICI